MYNEKELEIIQDFLKKYPDISEPHLDIISCIAGTVVELKRENPEELSRIEFYGKKWANEGTLPYGYDGIKLSETEKLALKELIHELLWLKEEK